MPQNSVDRPGEGVAAHAQSSTLDLLLAGQKEALELALSRAPLDEVLAVLIRTAQLQAGESAFGAIFILQPDGVHVKAGVSAQVPEAYARAVEAFPVGPEAPPCQVAILTGKPVIIEDLTRDPVWAKHGNGDPLWQNYFDAVKRFGVRSCWCQPIRTSDDRVLGAFVVYVRAPRSPDPRDVDSLGVLSHTAALIIERHQETEERSRAREALRRRTEQFETLFGQAPIGVYLVDADFRIREVNPAARPVFGSTSDLIGRDFGEVMHILWPEAYADEVVRLFRHTLDTGEPYFMPERIEERRDRSVVEYYEWQINRILLPDGRHGVVCYFRDVSAHVATRTQLEQQRADLQTMLDVMPIGVAIAHDREGDRITLNPRFAKELGLSAAQNASLSGPERESIPYQCHREGKVVPPDDLPMQRAARTGKDVRDEELVLTWPDGRVLNLRVSAVPLFDARGRVRGAIGAHVDITEYKRVQRELEAASRQKDEFLAMLAHELRNPLAPIRNAAELLSRDDPDAELSSKAVAIIQRQTTYLTRLVDDLLDVSRITRGRIVLKREVLQLSEIIDQAVETVTPLIKDKRHRLSVTSHGVLRVDGDAARLCQCISNLLTNAVKYTDAGGDIHIETLEEDHQAVVRVSDNGVGIAPDLLANVFDLFVQGKRTLERAQGGLGIGLAVVKRLVEMHGGRVSAASVGIGRGSTFEVRLPLVDAVEPRSSTGRKGKTPAMRILVIDDNGDAADSLAMVLRLEGHRVETAGTGEEALERVRLFRPDAVLLDIGLPGMDGYEVARRIRSEPESAPARLIALTGYGQLEDRNRAAAAGFDDHLVKPVDFMQLRDSLTRAIDRSE